MSNTSPHPAITKGVDLTELIKNNRHKPATEILDLMVNTNMRSNDIIAQLYYIGKQLGLEWLDLSELLAKILIEINQVHKTFVGGLVWQVIVKWAVLALQDGKLDLTDLPKVIQAYWEVKYNQ